MKSLSRILTVCLCCMPAFSEAAAPMATTAGNNLTAYNPSNAYNNQWATVTNGRYDNSPTAKADFGNCNAVVSRCAQPKCANGGCVDADVAAAIVSGCVKSNSKCQQYGDDLVSFMTAQLVASSNAKLNQQQVALEQAKIQAEANAKAQNEQISQMQNQLGQMQKQMEQQQAESATALKEALEQQSAQSAAALNNMKTAATDAAKQTEAGITAYQQEAINRGISEDVLARQQITGQIQTQIEDAEVSLKSIRTAMQNSFDYAGCDARGNNCNGPKRIKKWRELASGFITPYDTTIDKIYDALDTARMVGVDLSQIYAMLDDSCNSWAQYLCPGVGEGYYITYGYYENSEYVQAAPRVCKKTQSSPSTMVGLQDYDWKQCQPCRWLKPLTESEEIYAGWIETENEAKEQQRVVACNSTTLDSNPLFARRTRNKKGKGIVNIDLLETWIYQTEPDKKIGGDDLDPNQYCSADGEERILENSVLSRTVSTEKVGNSNTTFCMKWNDSELVNVDKPESEGCPYINPVYAICDTHPFNSGGDANWTQKSINSDEREKMHRIIGLKTTVISQQMYKQYEYLNATLRKLKTQLQKAVLTSNLEVAGAKSERTSFDVGGNDKTIHLAGANNCSNFMDFDSAYNCLQTNISLIKNNVSASPKKACLQLQETVSSADSILVKSKSSYATNCKQYLGKGNSKSCVSQKKDDIISCANALNMAVMNEKREQELEQRRTTVYAPSQNRP